MNVEIMKKSIFSALALIGLLAVSCSKEKEAPVLRTDEPVNTRTVSIKATIAPETRTSYTDDKTFSWVEKDSITVVTLSPDEEYIRLTTFYAQSSGPETIFTGEVEEGYTLYTMAFYNSQSHVHFSGEDGDSNLYFNLPTFTKIDGDGKKEYIEASSNPLANLPLIGVQQEEDDSYLFYTASGAAKFSFTDIPEGAAYFVIELSDVPLSGEFTWNDEGIITNDTARPGTYEYTGTDGQTHTARYANHYVVYEFERSADGTGTIYVPLPVGKIPAGAQVGFYDADLEELLYSRPVRSDIPIERNKVTEVATFAAAAEWESLGVGAYYDVATYYFMSEDVNTFTGVEIFKDANMPGVYRFTNPYPDAAEERGYTIPSTFELPEYLSFTVLKDNSVIYDDIHTGYNEEENLSEGAGDWFLGSPANWGGENSFNFVAKYQEDGTPDLVILSPFYLYLNNNSYYYALYSLGLGPDDWKQMFVEIYFPGADLSHQYDLNCSLTFDEIADDNPMQATANVTLTLGNQDATADLVPAFSGAVLVVAPDRETAREMVEAGLGTQATESGTYEVPFPADAPNGMYYAYAMTVPAEGFTNRCALLFDSDSAYEYFRSDEDRQLTPDDIVGNYTATGDYVAVVNNKAVWSYDAAMTMVIEENADPLSEYPITIVDVCPEVAAAYANGGTVTAQPIDAILDTAHGVVTIPAGQTAYTVRGRVGNKSLILSGDYLNKDIELFLRAPGVLEVSKWLYLVDGSNAIAGIAPDDDDPIVYTREGTSYAPARAKQHRPHYLPFRTPLEKNLGMFPELKKSKSEPRDERVPFPGLSNKAK